MPVLPKGIHFFFSLLCGRAQTSFYQSVLILVRFRLPVLLGKVQVVRQPLSGIDLLWGQAWETVGEWKEEIPTKQYKGD